MRYEHSMYISLIHVGVYYISASTLLENWKKLWNMKLKIIPIVIGYFSTIAKGLLKGQEDSEAGGRVETIQITVLLRTARILRRVL